MPLVERKSLPEVANLMTEYVRKLISTRRNGFFINEGMFGDVIALQYGLVLPTEARQAVFQQVVERFCPHSAVLDDVTNEAALEVAQRLEPVGVVAVMGYPYLAAWFSDVTDLVRYKLMLPHDKKHLDLN